MLWVMKNNIFINWSHYIMSHMIKYAGTITCLLHTKF